MQVSPLDAAALRLRVRSALVTFLDRQEQALASVSIDLRTLTDAATNLLVDGGKRLSPAFCYWGWRASGGAATVEDDDAVMTAAAALELLHACALIHDDVMDGSDTRRGQPAVHRRFGSTHWAERWQGSPEAFGESAAILLGDLCLVWADQMLATSGIRPEALVRAQPVYDEMRVELMAGQYLDLLEQAFGGHDVQRSMTVARYKSAKYTIERPLHLGAALACAPEGIFDCFSAYGVQLGEAFQLRDDVLGVFGDPSQTGKPAGDDLREGKRTVLVAIALDRADMAAAATVRRYLGDPNIGEAGIAAVQSVLTSTGALDEVEAMINERTVAARVALASARLDADLARYLDPTAVAVLDALAETVTSGGL